MSRTNPNRPVKGPRTARPRRVRAMFDRLRRSLGRLRPLHFAVLTAAGFKQIDFLDSFEVPADEGFKKGVKAETVPGDEDVVYSAVLIHAYK